jgi:hypothetical protein
MKTKRYWPRALVFSVLMAILFGIFIYGTNTVTATSSFWPIIPMFGMGLLFMIWIVDIAIYLRRTKVLKIISIIAALYFLVYFLAYVIAAL